MPSSVSPDVLAVKEWLPVEIITAEIAVPVPPAEEQLETGDFVPNFVDFIPPAIATPVEAPSKSSEDISRNAWLPPEINLSALNIRNGQSFLRGSFSEESELQAQRALMEARSKSEEILHTALSRADEITFRAEAQASDITQASHAQASEITRKAYSDGVAAAQAETTEMLRTVASIVEEVKAWRDSLFAQGELMMLRMVIEIAQSIFGEGLPLDPEVLGQSFSRALAEAKTLGDLRIYVHPEDAAVLGPLWARQQTTMSGQSIELVPSDIIKRGGCFVEGQFGSVDARVETQFSIATDTLMHELSNNEAGEL